MAESLSWSFTAGTAGGSINDSGSLDVEAMTSASVSVAAQSHADLNFQLADLSDVAFLAVKASGGYDGNVKIKADGQDAPEVILTGPLVLYGNGIALLGGSLAIMTLTNDGAEDATVEVLLGRKLTG